PLAPPSTQSDNQKSERNECHLVTCGISNLSHGLVDRAISEFPDAFTLLSLSLPASDHSPLRSLIEHRVVSAVTYAATLLRAVDTSDVSHLSRPPGRA